VSSQWAQRAAEHRAGCKVHHVDNVAKTKRSIRRRVRLARAHNPVPPTTG
jgi:hypothetical protein